MEDKDWDMGDDVLNALVILLKDPANAAFASKELQVLIDGLPAMTPEEYDAYLRGVQDRIRSKTAGIQS